MATRKVTEKVTIIYDDEYKTIQKLLKTVPNHQLTELLSNYKAERLLAKFGIERYVWPERDISKVEELSALNVVGRPRSYPGIYEMNVGDEYSVIIEEKKKERSFRMLVHQIGKKQDKKFKVNHGAHGHLFVTRVA